MEEAFQWSLLMVNFVLVNWMYPHTYTNYVDRMHPFFLFMSFTPCLLKGLGHFNQCMSLGRNVLLITCNVTSLNTASWEESFLSSRKRTGATAWLQEVSGLWCFCGLLLKRKERLKVRMEFFLLDWSKLSTACEVSISTYRIAFLWRTLLWELHTVISSAVMSSRVLRAWNRLTFRQ